MMNLKIRPNKNNSNNNKRNASEIKTEKTRFYRAKHNCRCKKAAALAPPLTHYFYKNENVKREQQIETIALQKLLHIHIESFAKTMFQWNFFHFYAFIIVLVIICSMYECIVLLVSFTSFRVVAFLFSLYMICKRTQNFFSCHFHSFFSK